MNTLESIAAKIWEISLAASWAMLLALPLLLLLRKPAYAPIRYAVGLLLIVRLLFPFSFQSDLSVQNYVPQPTVATEIVYEGPSMATGPAREPISILPLVWLAGVVVLAGRVLIQQLRVRRWIKGGTEVTLPALTDALGLMPVRRRVSVHIVPQITTPALTGLFRPKLLLPPAALENVNLRMVFLHELAHVRRWDILVKWAAIAARTLHWFNPLVWLLTRRLAADQELLADAAALRALGAEEQKAYGETLLALASDSRPSAAALLPISGNFKQMKERIGMITHFKPATRRTFVLATVFAAAFSFLAFTRAVDKQPPALRTGQSVPAVVSPERLMTLREEFHKLTALIDEKENRLDELRGKLRIVGPVPNEQALPGAELVRSLEQSVREVGASATETSRILERVNQYKRKNLGSVRLGILITTLRPDAMLTRYLADLSTAEQQFTVMSKDFGSEHPEVVRATSLIKNITKQIDERIEGTIAGLEATADLNEQRIKQLTQQIERAANDDLDMRRNSRPYFNLMRDIETMRQVRDSLHARLLQEEIEARVAKASN